MPVCKAHACAHGRKKGVPQQGKGKDKNFTDNALCVRSFFIFVHQKTSIDICGKRMDSLHLAVAFIIADEQAKNKFSTDSFIFHTLQKQKGAKHYVISENWHSTHH